MKNIAKILMLLIMVAGIQSTAYGQGKSEKAKEKVEKQAKDAKAKGNDKVQEAKQEKSKLKAKEIKKEKAEKELNESKVKAQDKKLKKEKKEKSNNGVGHAYGKNKGDLTGREFGQARAAEARQKAIATREVFVKKEKTVVEGKHEIERAWEIFQKQKEEGGFSEQVIKAKQERIENADTKLSIYEKAIQDAKEKIKKREERLAELAKEKE